MPSYDDIFKSQSLGDLADLLATLCKDPGFDPHLCYVHGPLGDQYEGFRIDTCTLSDGSEVYELEFLEADAIEETAKTEGK